jgi:NAD+ diphosphatase
LDDCKGLFSGSGDELSGDNMVYLGSRSEEDVVYWAINVSGENSLVTDSVSKQFCFVELRTLMVATDWADERAMSDLAVAGHVSWFWFSIG